MTDFTQLRANEIRDMLVKQNILTTDQASAIKGKKQLVQAYNSFKQNTPPSFETISEELADINFDTDIEPEEDKLPSVSAEKKEEQMPTPKYMQDGWADYVMTHFNEDELFQGLPTVTGLRRVAELLLGEIVISQPKTLTVLNEAVICHYELTVAFTRSLLEHSDGYIDLDMKIPERTFGGIGEASLHNVGGIYQKYLASMAETRAEGRTLKKALGIKCTVAEELNNETPMPGETNMDWDSESASDEQRTFIKLRCKSLGIDHDKFINKAFYTGESKEKTYTDISDSKLTRSVAASMVQEINKYQTSTKDSVDIPEEIKV